MKLLLLGIALIGCNAQRKCIFCNGIRNHMDEVISGEADCFEDGAKAEKFEAEFSKNFCSESKL